jgi:hypothetical protein
MATMTCPKCGSPDIRPATTDRVRNSYICLTCKYNFTLLGTANVPSWIASGLAIPTAAVQLISDIKKIFGDDSAGKRPPPSRHHQPGAIPHGHQPSVAPSPRHHQPPPVDGQSPPASPPRASPQAVGPGRPTGPTRSNPLTDPHAVSPRRPEGH